MVRLSCVQLEKSYLLKSYNTHLFSSEFEERISDIGYKTSVSSLGLAGVKVGTII